MLLRPPQLRRAWLLAATLIAACHFESAGLGETGPGPGDETSAASQASVGTTTGPSGSTANLTTGAESDSGVGSSIGSSDSDSDSDSDSAADTGGTSPAQCGNGIVEAGEQCDGGDDPPCTPVCTLNVCGDGYVGGREQCDEAGANGDDKGCTSACQKARCGDGLPGPGEACDDGNELNTDDCLAGCVLPSCGDGFQQIGVEACDLGAENGAYGGACNLTCDGPGPSCGDGVWDPQHELCDGDGAPPGADCKAGCQPECEFGKTDCNNNLADGCQGLLSDKNNCGFCGNKCPNFCIVGICS